MNRFQRHYQKLYSQGWKSIGWTLPPEVIQQVTDYKNYLMVVNVNPLCGLRRGNTIYYAACKCDNTPDIPRINRLVECQVSWMVTMHT
jgi:hypothetical protein